MNRLTKRAGLISMLDYPLVPAESPTTCAVCGVAMPVGALGVEVHPEGLACSAPCIHVLQTGCEYEMARGRIEEIPFEIEDLEDEIRTLEREHRQLEGQISQISKPPPLPLLRSDR